MTAVISSCGLYRYRLERDVPAGTGNKIACFIMVNPSTADATTDDATIRKVKTFARNAGARRLIVVNKFAYRATDIKALRSASAPIGEDNDYHIERAMREADIHIAAWGPLAKLPLELRSRWRTIERLSRRVGCQLLCLGTAQDGHPLHPLMLAYLSPLADWISPSSAAPRPLPSASVSGG